MSISQIKFDKVYVPLPRASCSPSPCFGWVLSWSPYLSHCYEATFLWCAFYNWHKQTDRPAVLKSAQNSSRNFFLYPPISTYLVNHTEVTAPTMYRTFPCSLWLFPIAIALSIRESRRSAYVWKRDGLASSSITVRDNVRESVPVYRKAVLRCRANKPSYLRSHVFYRAYTLTTARWLTRFTALQVHSLCVFCYSNASTHSPSWRHSSKGYPRIRVLWPTTRYNLPPRAGTIVCGQCRYKLRLGSIRSIFDSEYY